MANKYGRRSLACKRTIVKPLQRVFELALKKMDHSIIEGFRGEARQNRLYKEKKTKLRFPDSNHNKMPSFAGDVIPWPVDWDDYGRFYMLAAHIFRAAAELKARIRGGLDWDRDGDMKDQSFHDLPHFEYKGEADEDDCKHMLKLADMYEAAAKAWKTRKENPGKGGKKVEKKRKGKA